MPKGPGTYGSKVGRPKKKVKKMMGGGIAHSPIRKMGHGGRVVGRMVGASLGANAHDLLKKLDVFGTGRVKLVGGFIAAAEGSKMFTRKRSKKR